MTFYGTLSCVLVSSFATCRNIEEEAIHGTVLSPCLFVENAQSEPVRTEIIEIRYYDRVIWGDASGCVGRGLREEKYFFFKGVELTLADLGGIPGARQNYYLGVPARPPPEESPIHSWAVV